MMENIYHKKYFPIVAADNKILIPTEIEIRMIIIIMEIDLRRIEQRVFEFVTQILAYPSYFL